MLPQGGGGGCQIGRERTGTVSSRRWRQACIEAGEWSDVTSPGRQQSRAAHHGRRYLPRVEACRSVGADVNDVILVADCIAMRDERFFASIGVKDDL